VLRDLARVAAASSPPTVVDRRRELVDAWESAPPWNDGTGPASAGRYSFPFDGLLHSVTQIAHFSSIVAASPFVLASSGACAHRAPIINTREQNAGGDQAGLWARLRRATRRTKGGSWLGLLNELRRQSVACL
jgi:hypothetical protein